VPRAILGFMNAYMVTGNDRFLDVWRKQNARINAAAKSENGQISTPTMFGADGWYGYKRGAYRLNAGEIWYLSMRAEDKAQVAELPWVKFLGGHAPGWSEQALLDDMARVQKRLEAVRADTSTRETRLADNAIDKNPVSVSALLHQTMGAIHVARPPWSPLSPNQGGSPLYARLRHFDADAGTAGLPPDIAVLVEQLSDTSTTATIVNLSPIRQRRMVIRGGGYGEHRIEAVRIGDTRIHVGQRDLPIRIAPGAGATITLEMARHTLKPTLDWPNGF
jgi:hypothetical protein